MAGLRPAQAHFKRLEPRAQSSFRQVYSLAFKGQPYDTPSVPIAPNRELSDQFSAFHFSDLHHKLIHFEQASSPYHFLSLLTPYFQHKSLLDNESVLVSIGDDHTGSPLDHFLGSAHSKFDMSAAYRSYSLAGLDAAVIGNHDLDMGTENLKKAIQSDAAFPVLSANIQGDLGHVPGIVGVTPSGLRVGLLGLTTTEPRHNFSQSGPSLIIEDPLTALDRYLPTLLKNSDVVFLLSHLGLQSTPNGVVNDLDLAKHIAAHYPLGRVFILGGHSHQSVQPIDLTSPVPIAHAGYHGRYLGEFKLQTENLSRSKNLKFQSTFHQNQGQPSADILSSDLFAFQQSLFEQLQPELTSPLIQLNHTDSEASPKNEFNCLACQFVADSIHEQFQVYGQHTGHSADLVLMNDSSIQSEVRLGNSLNRLQINALFPYTDQAVLVELTGRQLLAVLDENLRRWTADQPHNHRLGFLRASKALRLQIQGGPGKRKILRADLNGESLHDKPEKTYRVLIPAYVFQGNEDWEDRFFREPHVKLEIGLKTLLLQYAAATSSVSIQNDGRLSLVKPNQCYFAFEPR